MLKTVPPPNILEPTDKVHEDFNLYCRLQPENGDHTIRSVLTLVEISSLIRALRSMTECLSLLSRSK